MRTPLSSQAADLTRMVSWTAAHTLINISQQVTFLHMLDWGTSWGIWALRLSCDFHWCICFKPCLVQASLQAAIAGCIIVQASVQLKHKLGLDQLG